MARTCAQNGTEKDSQEGQKETGKAKNDPEKNLWGDLKKMELTWGTAEREAKERHGGKGVAALIWIDRINQRRRHVAGILLKSEAFDDLRKKVIH